MTNFIDNYEKDLDDIEAHKKDLDPQRVLTLLLGRDRIAEALGTAGSNDRLTERTKITELDQRLRKLGTVLVKRVGAKTLADWRASLKPDKAAWWWSLDENVSTSEEKGNTIWVLTTAFLLALSIAYSVDITTRFLSGGSDTIGYQYTAIQVFLTFIAGSAFTEAGRQWVKGLGALVGLPHRAQPFVSCVIAALVLIGVSYVKQSLPQVSKQYNSKGATELAQEKNSAAIDDLKRAIALDPDNTQAHYNLAVAYESILDYDKAIGEYQHTIELDSTYALAYNNMARLFILKNADYDRALEALSKIIYPDGTIHGNSPDPEFLQYTALKNRGWALWGLKNTKCAESDLKLASKTNGREANALYAQLLEGDSRKSDAVRYWHQAADPDKPIKPDKPIEHDFIDKNLYWLALQHDMQEKDSKNHDKNHHRTAPADYPPIYQQYDVSSPR